METWSLQDAKARFSEAVRICQEQGSLLVTKHGEPSVVMLSTLEYDKLKARKNSLKDFFLAAPRVDLEITRSQDLGREVEL